MLALGLWLLIVVMPLRLHAVHEMQPTATDVARSVVCVSVCWAHGWAVQKTSEPSDWSKDHSLDGGKNRTNPFAAVSGDKTAMRPFAKLLWALTILHPRVTSVSCVPEIGAMYRVQDKRQSQWKASYRNSCFCFRRRSHSIAYCPASLCWQQAVVVGIVAHLCWMAEYIIHLLQQQQLQCQSILGSFIWWETSSPALPALHDRSDRSLHE